MVQLKKFDTKVSNLKKNQNYIKHVVNQLPSMSMESGLKVFFKVRLSQSLNADLSTSKTESMFSVQCYVQHTVHCLMILSDDKDND
jgi:hypothetical protein